jgi:hypothetical protein
MQGDEGGGESENESDVSAWIQDEWMHSRKASWEMGKVGVGENGYLLFRCTFPCPRKIIRGITFSSPLL